MTFLILHFKLSKPFHLSLSFKISPEAADYLNEYFKEPASVYWRALILCILTLPFFYAKSGVEGFTFSRIAAHLEGFIRKKESMMWYQQTLTLGPKSRGFHLVTDEILGQIRGLSG